MTTLREKVAEAIFNEEITNGPVMAITDGWKTTMLIPPWDELIEPERNKFREMADAAIRVILDALESDDIWPHVMTAMQDVDTIRDGEPQATHDDLWKAALSAARKELEK